MLALILMKLEAQSSKAKRRNALGVEKCYYDRMTRVYKKKIY